MFEPEEELTAVLSEGEPSPVGPSDSSRLLLETEDDVPVRQLSQWQLTWIRFRRHKPALIGSAVLLFFIVMAIIGPFISPENYFGFSLTKISSPPELSWHYLMGTDNQGHAVIMYVLLGARISLMVGILSGLFATLLGILVGATAGYFGGLMDATWMRITDIFLTLPFLPLIILVSAFLGGGNVWYIIIIFGVLGWPGVARLIRSYYLTLREQEFTLAARSVGVSTWRIMFRHILPNALSPVIVSFTLAVAAFIIGEAAIDFLGVGIKIPTISWGVALAGAQQDLEAGNWWWAFFPGICLLLVVLAVNFIGDGLRDALDVRARATE